MFSVEEISLQNKNQVNQVVQFLRKFNLNYDNDIDFTIVVYDQEKLIGTASKHRNVLKCFAVEEVYQGLGIVNTLVKTIEDQMFKEGIYHFFIFTKELNKQKFESIGYKEILTIEGITLLENGSQRIESFLYGLKAQHQLTDDLKACIVMNANPFTLGHRYLIETASRENEWVIVFVVSENQSTFSLVDRYQLVKQGVKDLINVTVLETGPYLVSSLTFPAYFLKDSQNKACLEAKIDCEMFIKYFKPIFNINRRYVGSEPYSEVTHLYNQVMKDILPQNGVNVTQIERKKWNDDYISASLVRELVKTNQFERLRELVPDVTYHYLKNRGL